MHLQSFRFTLILPHFMSKHVPLEIKRNSQTFLELSRSVEPCSAEIRGIRYAVDEDEAERCPQEESLKVVLGNLGIAESDLQRSLHDFPGVKWESPWQCNKNQQKIGPIFFGTTSFVTKSRQICEVLQDLCPNVGKCSDYKKKKHGYRKQVKLRERRFFENIFPGLS